MQTREKKIYRVTVWGAVVNVLLACLKFVAGLAGRSTAMLADAVHSLSDLVSDVVVVVMVHFASKDKDRGHEYGHGKFETLATAAISLLLLVVGAKLMTSGIVKIKEIARGASLEAPGAIAFWMAIVSVIAKEVLYRWTDHVGKSAGSAAVSANAWHHRSDALSSIASAIGIGAAIALGGKWVILDPAVGCVISIFIVYVAVKMSIPALAELTEASLPEEDEKEMIQIALSVDGVNNVHDLKTRRNGTAVIVDAHIVVDPDMSVACAHAITAKVEAEIRKKFGKETQISLHIEPSLEAE